jgi:N-acetylmuramoyl-L-alanine amidase
LRRRLLAAATLPLLLVVAAAGAGCGGDDSAEGAGSTSVPPSTTSPGSTSVPGASTAGASVPKTPGTTAPTAPAGQRAVVVIDPGHNGGNGAHPDVINQPVDAGGFTKPCNTTGASTNDGTTESAINWAVAQLLRDRLVAAGIDVVMTRDSDTGVGPCVDERGLAAANAGASLLVSIHADGAGGADHGFHVIHPGLRPGYTDASVGPSNDLAVRVRDALVAARFAPAGYVGSGGLDERDDLGTLNRAGVPAVMLEAGNLRNADDAALLTSPDGQARVADAVAAAVLAYLG